MKNRIVTIAILTVAGFIIGFFLGYLIFGKTGGQYVSLGQVLSGPRNVFEGLGNAVLGVKKIRQNVFIVAGVGAVLGLAVGIIPLVTKKSGGGKRSKKRR